MREPSLVGSGSAVSAREPGVAPPRQASRAPSAAKGHVVTVAGFWRRSVAGLVDALVLLPIASLFSWVTFQLADVHLPPARQTAIDYWLDLALAGEPAIWATLGLLVAIAVIYVLVFQVTLARTLGMKLLGLKVIDLYGEPPALWRAGVRTLGYLASLATLGLGFVWVGFDAEKRALHDWIAGTYVIRDEAGK